MTQPPIDIPGYELLRQIGSGGMATVYLATQTSLDRRVAIKVMRRAGADESYEKRFLFEGRTMAKLPHRNIVGVYDIVQNPEINYIAMEYLPGGTLSDRLREGLSLAEAIAIVVQIAGALQFAHDNGVVHRDLKPANIMFRDAHTPVLTDFGIARQHDSEATRLTQTGMMVGTPTYMSPEQATGANVDGRSDQYSLGVLFYEMLTGNLPFEGETPLNVVLAHLHQPPPPLSPQFAHFQPVMDRLLAKDPDQRYGDLKQFVVELKSLLTQSDTLMARLQIDPSQSASEQLRALGFSESQINTGAGTSPSAIARAAAARSTGGSRRSTGPGVRMDPLRGKRPGWLVPAAAGVALLVLVVVGWLVFAPDDGLSDAERVLVDSTLRDTDRLIEQGQLVSPAGENAFEKLQYILQVAPGLEEAEQRVDRIAATLKQQAEDALTKGSFAVAETRIGEALAVAPEDPELAALRTRVETSRRAAETSERIAQLLERAEEARNAGRLAGEGPGTALGLLRQAVEVDPRNAQAQERLKALVEALLAPARADLERGEFDQAEGKARALAASLAAEKDWQDLLAEVDAARQRAAQRERIASLLATAQRQVQADRLAEPAGDNALETLARLREIDSRNPEALALVRSVGTTLAERAARAVRDGNMGAGLALYEQALRAVPGERTWMDARTALQSRLGERETRLAAALSGAREAIVQRNYFVPAGTSAYDQVQRALEIDPGNADARSLREQIPKLAAETADALAAEGRHEEALRLVEAALQRYAGNATLTSRQGEIRRAADRAAASGRRQQLVAGVRTRLAEQYPTVESTRAQAAALSELLEIDPDDREVRAYRDTFLGGVLRSIYAAETEQQLQALAPLIEAIEKGLPEDPSVSALSKDFAAKSEQIVELERERLAATRGVLVIDAHPWAEVVAVVDQGSGKNVTLPKERSTPMRLDLPAGTYRLSLRHPDVAAPVALVATVQAKTARTSTARFPTLRTEDFLRRAGYAP
ncbi:MAG TPA: protein kinase [Xanthomonadaceae bacterium]|nr:protein kinase [Xanthomonadaceae bacterium]